MGDVVQHLGLEAPSMKPPAVLEEEAKSLRTRQRQEGGQGCCLSFWDRGQELQSFFCAPGLQTAWVSCKH